VSVKKAKGKGKGTAKKSGNKSKSTTKKPANMMQVRENINNLVRLAARDIATEVIKVAKTGQLASAKYLFEAVGLYPATEETLAKPLEDSLAHTLLRRMGLPTEPLICDEDEVLAAPVSALKSAAGVMAGHGEEDPVSEEGQEQDPEKPEE
jgi:hypothetical protein